MFLIFLFLYSSIFKFVESTDLAVVYKHGILHLTEAEKPSANYSLLDNSIFFKLKKEFDYPIGIAYDPLSKNLFISDANDYNVEIYAFSISSKEVPKLKKIINKNGKSTIESLSYNPVERRLYWTNSKKNGIYRTHTLGEEMEDPSVALIDSTVHKPRGIAVDPCHSHLFWSERAKKLRRITDHNLANGTNERITEATSDIFYQAVAFDAREGQLVWAETIGDEATNSSCNILKYSTSKREIELFAIFEKCYPFSMALDDDYIYWTDWAAEGVMRLSKNDPKDLVMLIKTPSVETKEGTHNGAFGLVNLNDFNIQECQTPGPIELTAKYEEEVLVDLKIEPFECKDGSSGPLAHMRKMYRNLLYAFVASLCICCCFILSTFYLIIRTKLWPRKNKVPLENCAALPTAVDETQVGRRKKHKKFNPFQQAEILGRSSDDGIKIDIEDCCQMTLCDTPCYTSLKKEGKPYLKGQNSPTNKFSNDYKGLLDEQDFI